VRLAAWVLLLFAASALAQDVASIPNDVVQERTFFSASLQRKMPYDVVLPAGYVTSGERYPVLYLLHGWEGDQTNWVKMTHLVEYASAYKLIIVTPRADNSWYVNSASRPEERYADSIEMDLPKEIDANFRTIALPRARAIGGLSMGGYGALLLTMRHPSAFAFAASISGAFSGPTGIEGVLPALMPSVDLAFGPAGSRTRSDNNLDLLIASDDPATQPYLFIECGTKDALLSSNRHLVAELSDRGMAYEYHEYPGAHTWVFWNHALPQMLAVLAQQMHVGTADGSASTGRDAAVSKH
jgi:putative tributyrin esterase